MATININDEKKAYSFFLRKGLTPAGACGLIGNLEAESDGFYPDRLEYLCVKRLKENGKTYTDASYTAAIDSGKISCEEFLHPLPGKQYGYGLAQWTTASRKSGLWTLAKHKGVSIADLDMQLDYLMQELEEKFPSVLEALKTTNSIQEASDIVLVKFESPANASALKASRAARGKKFYEKVKEDEMTDLEKLIDLAEAELGYIEKASNASLDSKTANKGTANYTKYARDITKLGLMGCQAQPWCATFQFWLEVQAVGLSQALENWNMTKNTYCGYNCFSIYNMFKKAGKTSSTPKVGSLVVFNHSHIGRVIAVGQNTFTTIEGNTSAATYDRNGGMVARKKYSVNDSKIKGFCIIDYGETCAGATIRRKWYRIRKSWINASSQIGAYKDLAKAKAACKPGYTVYDWNGNAVYTLDEYPWVGKCTGNGVNVRKGPGTGYANIAGWPKLNKGNLFDVLGKEGIWHRILIGKKHEGYIAEQYVKRV